MGFNDMLGTGVVIGAAALLGYGIYKAITSPVPAVRRVATPPPAWDHARDFGDKITNIFHKMEVDNLKDQLRKEQEKSNRNNDPEYDARMDSEDDMMRAAGRGRQPRKNSNRRRR